MNPYEVLKESPDSLPYIGDLFEEQGRLNEAETFRKGYIGYGYGYGYGYGHGSGYGYGYGFGSGYGHGYGSDHGYGYGYGYGYGHGSGFGSGHGFIISHILKGNISMNDAVAGKNYMIFVPPMFAYVGRFVRPTGLHGAIFEECSNIHDTNNGANWNDLAAGVGNSRSVAEFKKYQGRKIFPYISDCSEWVGELP